MQPHSLYLHIPFCRHRCAYCDFNTYAGLEQMIPDYVAALCQEIEWLALIAEGRIPVHTIFFGGGTPSLLSAPQIEQILATIARHYKLLPGIEISLEANPGTLSLDCLRDLYHSGVNRLSLGVQSADPGELHLLERQHDYTDVIHAVVWARKAGFDNINLDLIYGLPYQAIDSWEHNLSLVLGLAADHLSLYALSLEHGTPMYQWVSRGLMAEPEPDLAADMYELAAEMLENAGYTQYEISNWARRTENGNLKACRHNMQYWRLLPYLGFGAGAHGFVSSTHTMNVLSPRDYIRRMQAAGIPADEARKSRSRPTGLFPRTPATASINTVDRTEEMGEVMMMGLRLIQEGISDFGFEQRFGMRLRAVYGAQVETLREKGLLEWQGEILRLTPAGRLLGNQVFMEFI